MLSLGGEHMVLELIQLVYLCFEKIFNCIFQRKVVEQRTFHGIIESRGLSLGGSFLKIFLKVGSEDVQINIKNIASTNGIFCSDIVKCIDKSVIVDGSRTVSINGRNERKVYRWFVSWLFSDRDKSELRELTNENILIAHSSQDSGPQKHFFIIPTA